MEIDISKIKPFSRWQSFFYGSRGIKGFVNYPYIYFNIDIYEDIISTNPDPLNIGMVLHEFEHIKRIEKMGKYKFIFLYSISNKFRLKEEIEADKSRFKYLKDLNININLEERARKLSGIIYFWMISYKKALILLQKT